MRNLESRLAALESQVQELRRMPRLYFLIGNTGQTDPQLTEADITAFRADGLLVQRLPGEALPDLQARCAEASPATVAWFACYGGAA